MKYEIKKISVSSFNSDGSHVYDDSCEFHTAKEMFSRLAEMEVSENSWFVGHGSNIFKNDEIIAHTNDYRGITIPEEEFTHRMIAPTPSIKRLIEHAELTA